LIYVDKDDNWFVFDEFYESGKTIDYIAGVVNSKRTVSPITATYGDPSGAQWIQEFAQRGIYITPATKEVRTNFNSWVRYGIEKVAEKLKQTSGKSISINYKQTEKGCPGLFIFSGCTNAIREFETYRWKEKSVSQAQDLNEPDVPEKANDHAMSALRYFAVSYKTPAPIEEIPDDTKKMEGWY